MAPFLIDEYPPNAAPGAGTGGGCFTCGAPRRTSGTAVRHPGGELLVDLGVNTDIVEDAAGMHGAKRPILCEQCVIEIGGLVGMLPPHRTDRLLADNYAQIQRMMVLEDIAEQYRALKETLARVKVDS
jgi:hypothetical protein